jgi:hypothetical protein
VATFKGLPPPPPPAPTVDYDVRLYDSAGQRIKFDKENVAEVTFEILERGGCGTGSLRALRPWETPLNGGERVDVWLKNAIVYRGRVGVPQREVPGNGDRYSPTFYGLIEAFGVYEVTRKYAYTSQVDLSVVFTDMVTDFARVSGRYPSLVIDSQVVSVPLTAYEFDQRGKSLAQAINALCDLAPNACIWGGDVDGFGADRAYLRPRSTTVTMKYSAGQGGEISQLLYPPDRTKVRNRAYLKGGSLTKNGQPNLLTNGSFEEASTPGELAGNLLRDYSFEEGTPSTFWTLNAGATVKYLGHPTAHGSARTGKQWLELDTAGENGEQTAYVVPGRKITGSCWARREDVANANAVRIEMDCLNAAGTVVVSPAAAAYDDPGASGLYKRYTITQDLAAYPTVVKAKVRPKCNGGTASNDGILIDDVALFHADMPGQPGWRVNAGGAASLAALDWAYTGIAAYHGFYSTKLQGAGIAVVGTDFVEMRTDPDSRAAVAPNERYTGRLLLAVSRRRELDTGNPVHQE